MLDYENYNKRELKILAINRSADIDYNDFMKIYRECTKERYSLLTIDATPPASDPVLKSYWVWFVLILMTRLKQIKLNMT